MSKNDCCNFHTNFQLVNKHLETRSFIIDKNNMVLFDSDHNDSKIGNVIDNKIVNDALIGQITYDFGTFNNYFKDNVYAIGVPIIKDNNNYGVIVMTSKHYSQIKKYIAFLITTVFIVLLIILILAIIYTYIFSRRTNRIIEEFSIISNKIASGDFTSTIDISNKGEFTDLAKSMNYMSSELANIEHKRNDFIANISHDFRSPLTSIRGFVQAILDKTIPISNQDKYLKIVLEETDRLTSLTNNILLLSKMEDGKIIIEKIKFDIHQVIKKVLLQFEHAIIDKDIEITLLIDRKSLFVYADLNQIQRVLHNLIDNAVKFCKAKDKITIETTILKNKVEISISDTGPGISENDIKYIWNRFNKADRSRGIDRKGVGLGLSIVKEIIKAHGETINVESKVGKGTTFIFTLSLP